MLALAAVIALAAAVPGIAPANEGKRPRAVVTSGAPDRETAGKRASQFALEAVGIPYRWGGESLASGFDCSGLVRWAYGRVGIDLPHSSYALYAEGRRVSDARLEPGDLLFFEGLGHVGLYVGRGRMVHAPKTGRDVEVVRLEGSSYGSRLIGARRVAPE
jgi:cell wall-associated NlpC family hydrolase